MLVSKGNYIYMGVNEIEKNGNVFRFVKIADADNYVTESYFADKELFIDANLGNKVVFEVKPTSFNGRTNFNIVSVKAVR